MLPTKSFATSSGGSSYIGTLRCLCLKVSTIQLQESGSLARTSLSFRFLELSSLVILMNLATKIARFHFTLASYLATKFQ